MPKKKSPRKTRGAHAHRLYSGGVEIWLSKDMPDLHSMINNLSVPFVEENTNHPLVTMIQHVLEDAKAPLERIEVHTNFVVGIYQDSTNKMCMVAVLPTNLQLPTIERY